MRSILPETSAFIPASRSAWGGAAQADAIAQNKTENAHVIFMDTHQCTKLNLMRFSLIAAVAALGAASFAAAPFTIEQAISAPFPSELTASPEGGKLAWVFNERGARNVWVAEASQYRGRRLTNYRADDGQEIS